MIAKSLILGISTFLIAGSVSAGEQRVGRYIAKCESLDGRTKVAMRGLDMRNFVSIPSMQPAELIESAQLRSGRSVVRRKARGRIGMGYGKNLFGGNLEGDPSWLLFHGSVIDRAGKQTSLNVAVAERSDGSFVYFSTRSNGPVTSLDPDAIEGMSLVCQVRGRN